MYLTTVKLVLRNSFDLNYLRKMCGTWVRWFPDILFQSIQADSHFIDRRLIDRRRDESSLSGRLAMAANHILSISELPKPRTSASEVWQRLVRPPDRFLATTIERWYNSLPVEHLPELKDWWSYLVRRYSWLCLGGAGRRSELGKGKGVITE